MTRRSVFKAADLGELINALPAMFGFPPANSLVVLGMEGKRVVFGMRVDLPRPDGVRETAQVAIRQLEHQRVEGAITLAVGEPLDVAERLVRAVEEGLVTVRPVAGGWATDDRYWVTMAGGDPRGHAYRRSLDHPAAAQAIWEGQEIVASREEMAAACAPVTGERRAQLDESANAMLEKLTTNFSALTDRRIAAFGKSDIQPVVAALRADEPVSDESLAYVGFLLRYVPARDAVWDQITPANCREIVPVWLHIARHVPLAWAPPAYCLAAFASWLCGDGARAVIALDHALAIDDEYSMANLLLELVMSGLSPQIWATVRAAS